MGLRSIAESDLSVILEDSTYGFGYAITVTDPTGNVGNMVGYSNDISQIVDPDTGQIVSGRVASIALRISSLTTKGLGLPEGISDTTKKPWIINFNDINGNAYKFKVSRSNHDRALGLVTCLLELYK